MRMPLSCFAAWISLAASWAVAAEPAPVLLSLTGATTNQVELTPVAEGEWQLRSTGGDPFVEIRLPELARPADVPVLAFEYFSPEGVGGIELRLRGDGEWTPPLDAAALEPAEGWLPVGMPLSRTESQHWEAGGWRWLRIDLGTETGVTLRVRKLALRTPSAEELQSREEAAQVRARKSARAAQIAAYLERDFSASISSVAVDATSVRIRGRRPGGEDSLWLAEIPLHGDAIRRGTRQWVTALGESAMSGTEKNEPQGHFAIELPRFDAGRDRLTSRWQVVRGTDTEKIFEPLSHASYATDLDGIGSPRLDPPPQLQNAKGLGGVSPLFGLDELLELGVQHLTVNVVISGLLNDAPVTEQRRQRGGGPQELFEHNGRQWWVNRRRLSHVDQVVAFATEHHITVAAILLLRTGDSDILIHPEASRDGIYAMPNFEDPAAVEKYEAVLALLAERYSGVPGGAGPKPARVDHWILHNEIDYGWTWTNMGHQPLEIYLDSYIRSMRLAYLQARRFNPFAKVFVSLTHHWNVPPDPTWKTYPPRELLERLAQFTAAEGDFGWGVAHHPYPESLWNSRTWEDTRVQDDFDTPLITMKNIDVLQRFLELPRMRDADGQMRPVLLSEQGYHTDGYGEEAQRDQAAALLYTWDRLRSVECVLAYDYHRWVDAAGEGGLLLGLRMLPGEGKPAGDKKRAWEVYRAIGTAEEAKWRERLEPLYRAPPRPHKAGTR